MRSLPRSLTAATLTLCRPGPRSRLIGRSTVGRGRVDRDLDGPAAVDQDADQPDQAAARLGVLGLPGRTDAERQRRAGQDQGVQGTTPRRIDLDVWQSRRGDHGLRRAGSGPPGGRGLEGFEVGRAEELRDRLGPAELALVAVEREMIGRDQRGGRVAMPAEVAAVAQRRRVVEAERRPEDPLAVARREECQARGRRGGSCRRSAAGPAGGPGTRAGCPGPRGSRAARSFVSVRPM